MPLVSFHLKTEPEPRGVLILQVPTRFARNLSFLLNSCHSGGEAATPVNRSRTDIISKETESDTKLVAKVLKMEIQ